LIQIQDLLPLQWIPGSLERFLGNGTIRLIEFFGLLLLSLSVVIADIEVYRCYFILHSIGASFVFSHGIALYCLLIEPLFLLF
jgi:hypothetical protein